MAEEGGRRREGGEKKGEGGGGPQLSDEISSAEGLVLGLSIHPSNSSAESGTYKRQQENWIITRYKGFHQTQLEKSQNVSFTPGNYLKSSSESRFLEGESVSDKNRQTDPLLRQIKRFSHVSKTAKQSSLSSLPSSPQVCKQLR